MAAALGDLENTKRTRAGHDSHENWCRRSHEKIGERRETANSGPKVMSISEGHFHFQHEVSRLVTVDLELCMSISSHNGDYVGHRD